MTTTTATTATSPAADRTDGGLWPQNPPSTPAEFPTTGVDGGFWHAVDRTTPNAGRPQNFDKPEAGGAARALAVCGAPVAVAATFGPFDRSRFPGDTCLDCVWTLAVGTGTEAGELAWLRTHHQPGVAALAEAILTACDDPAADYERDHPATLQLLVAVSAHAPVDLVDLECADECCEHYRQQGQRCPILVTACPTCSVRTGLWDGELAGEFLPECTIAGPCEVLRALAGHYKVPMPAPTPPLTAASTVGG